jgi:hypothetical protein
LESANFVGQKHYINDVIFEKNKECFILSFTKQDVNAEAGYIFGEIQAVKMKGFISCNFGRGKVEMQFLQGTNSLL